jgi:hypothetical protein
MTLPQGSERWVIVRTSASAQRAQASLQRQVSRAQASWQRKCWHLGTRRFACEADARAALERELKGKPTWVEVHGDVVAHARHAGKGRPRKDASSTTYQWQIVATVTVNQQRVDEEALRKACFIVGTNELQSEALSDQELVTTYKDQGGVERGFRAPSRSAVSGLLGHSLETGAHHRFEFDYGPMLAGLSLSRSSTASTPDRDRADHSRSSRQADSTPDDALSSFNASRALSCCMYRPPSLHSPSC